MIERVVIKNDYASNNELNIVLDNPYDSNTSRGFAITNIKGLGPGKATLNSSEWATVDGAEFTSARLPKRTISIDFTFIPTKYSESVADIRLLSYKIFPIKEHVRLYFYTYLWIEDDHGKMYKDTTVYYIDGRVEKNEPTIWSKSEGCTVDIVCFDPYFKNKDTNEISFGDVQNKFHYPWIDEDEDIRESSTVIPIGTENPHEEGWFERDNDTYTLSEDTTVDNEKTYYYFDVPSFIMSEKVCYDVLSIENPSYVTTGGIFTIRANGTVKNPVIFNQTTYQEMIIQYTMHKGDVIEIDTRKGYKSVTLKDGFGVNLINSIDITSDWIEMVPGLNNVGYTSLNVSQRNYLDVKVKVLPIYSGI